VNTHKPVGSGNIFFLILLLLAGTACREWNFSPGGEVFGADIASDRLKLLVGEAGLYRVTAAELSASGLDITDGLAYENLNLSTGQVEVPFLIRENALIFYGQPANDRYYAERPYMLQVGKPGQAMSRQETKPAGEPLREVVRQTVRLEEDQNYVPESREGESQ
jgi:hypothetical protein